MGKSDEEAPYSSGKPPETPVRLERLDEFSQLLVLGMDHPGDSIHSVRREEDGAHHKTLPSLSTATPILAGGDVSV